MELRANMLMNIRRCVFVRFREAFREPEARAEKTLDLLADLDPHGSCQSSSQTEENGVCEQQRAALVRWRGAPCQARERAVVAARGREAQLCFVLQVFEARLKVAVRRDKRTHLQEILDRAAEAADNGNVDEVYRLLKPWVKPRYKAPPCVKLDNGQWARTPDEAAGQRRRQYEATFKGQVITCAELAVGREKRAEEREPCWGIVPPTVDEVLDLILSASRGKARGVDGITAEVLGAGGRPMTMLLQPLFAGVCLQRALSIMWKGGVMATIPSGKNKTRGDFGEVDQTQAVAD